MSASGRKRTVRKSKILWFERPLSGKADIETESSEIGSPSVRFTPDSGR